MSKTIVPVKLRPHLIPFFYKEFKADVDAHYLNSRVKACKIVTNSSIGKLIRIALDKADLPIKPQKFYIYLSVPSKMKEKSTAHIYQTVNGTNSFLKVPEKVASDINDVFEDLFRFSFVNTVATALKYVPGIKIESVILDFMTEYQLEEYGFRIDSMRSLYNREVKKRSKLTRFQTRSSNRVLNYSS
ncbi:hypothetical protein [Tenacibaculum soleae]|uniref:hypothetical protein n=1 Tax=Tenacibaculum soleae TaxID=447689 RepID=UPI0023007ECA|nr:hypothetical protein [Tenacibaculum soleae]